MIDIDLIRNEPDTVRKSLDDQGYEDFDLETVISLDSEWRELKAEEDELRHQRNVLTSKIQELEPDSEQFDELVTESKEVKSQIQDLESDRKSVKEELEGKLLRIPNIPEDNVPVGDGEEDNVEIRRDYWEKRPTHPNVTNHWEVGEELNIIDEPRGAKVSGSNYYFLKGDGARLEQALIDFMRDIHYEQGYTEITPPVVINMESMKGTGQYPHFVETEGSYKVEDEDLWLSPTSEIALVNMHRDEILNDVDVPLKYQAATANFRKEAGQHGTKTRGLRRVHQFNKVEMVHITDPTESYDHFEMLLDNAEEVLRRLELPYRVLDVCTGDLPFSCAKTYDLELWSPAQEDWLEVSSVSNCEAFQGRRADIRYRPNPHDDTQYAHTLNGTGIALPRTFIALIENNQNPDGTISIPDALQEYMGGQEVIEGVSDIGESSRA